MCKLPGAAAGWRSMRQGLRHAAGGGCLRDYAWIAAESEEAVRGAVNRGKRFVDDREVVEGGAGEIFDGFPGSVAVLAGEFSKQEGADGIGPAHALAQGKRGAFSR